jgi:hypothetical protein
LKLRLFFLIARVMVVPCMRTHAYEPRTRQHFLVLGLKFTLDIEK